MYLRCVILVSVVTCSMGLEFEELGGVEASRAQPLTRRKMVHCFDENVKYLGPKSFEVEKHNRNEETRMSITRSKRRAKCTVETTVLNDDPSDGYDRSYHHHRHHNPPPKNFNTKTSYSVSRTVTSPPVEHNFNTRHSSSSADSDVSSQIAHDSHPILENLPTIPHLPAIPHIGHEATYPHQGGGAVESTDENDRNAHDTAFGGPEPGPGEKTITFKTNTHRQEKVDQRGFVREKTNGYPVRPNEDWRARFKDMPFLVDENGRIIGNAASSTFDSSFFGVKFTFVLLLQIAIWVFLAL
ncbi:uncharacterized protein LOC124292939 isoform X1 [Neodiprion lecontei]|uniref:Uncharacterized protein LOC124292939 isoform X1 n=2 Tax=Neodiprion lecontei TaxID=441921 RepID=A0ABM3FI25_NEOLC|nr:uncharacterized protein LOC124292939 isoform X1 [Neodiprion lecontei]